MANLKMPKDKKHWCGNEDGDNVFHFAAACDMQKLVLQYLQEGVDINLKNKMGWDALMQAARNGHSKCVKLLINHGADVMSTNKYGITPIVLASASGDINTVEILFKELYKLKETYENVENPISPLAIASLFSHINIVNYFITNSMNINSLSVRTALTPLMFAASVQSKEIMNLLFKHNADSNIVNINNETVSQIFNDQQTSTRKGSIKSSLRLDLSVIRHGIGNIAISNSPQNSRMQYLKPVQKFRHSSNCSTSHNEFPEDVSPIPDCASIQNDTFVREYNTSDQSGSFNVLFQTREGSINVFESYAGDESWNKTNSRLNIQYDSSRFFTDLTNIEKSSLLKSGDEEIFSHSNRQDESLHLDNAEKIQNWFRDMRVQRNKRSSLSDLPCEHRHQKLRRLSWNVPSQEFRSDSDDLFTLRLVLLLQKHYLGHLIPIFLKQEIEYDIFLTLNEDDLKEIGINCQKEINKLLDVISSINSRKK